jgi:hypothetical protein
MESASTFSLQSAATNPNVDQKLHIDNSFGVAENKVRGCELFEPEACLVAGVDGVRRAMSGPSIFSRSFSLFGSKRQWLIL